MTLPCDELVRTELRVIIAQIRNLNQSIRELEKTIAEEVSKLQGPRNLTSIKDIGKITGAILLSVIGDEAVTFTNAAASSEVRLWCNQR